MKKYFIDVWFMLGLAFCFGGCTTGGLVIGPFSNLASQSNERTMAVRSLEISSIPQEKKVAAIRAVDFGGNPGAVVVGLGIDVTALMENHYTIAELAKSTGGALLDTALYGGVAWGAGQIANSLSNNNSGNGALTINGSVYNSSINNSQGNSAAVSSTQASATQTHTVTR